MVTPVNRLKPFEPVSPKPLPGAPFMGDELLHTLKEILARLDGIERRLDGIERALRARQGP